MPNANWRHRQSCYSNHQTSCRYQKEIYSCAARKSCTACFKHDQETRRSVEHTAHSNSNTCVPSGVQLCRLQVSNQVSNRVTAAMCRAVSVVSLYAFIGAADRTNVIRGRLRERLRNTAEYQGQHLVAFFHVWCNSTKLKGNRPGIWHTPQWSKNAVLCTRSLNCLLSAYFYKKWYRQGMQMGCMSY